MQQHAIITRWAQHLHVLCVKLLSYFLFLKFWLWLGYGIQTQEIEIINICCKMYASDFEKHSNTASVKSVFENSPRSSGSRVHWQRRRCRRRRAEWGTALCLGRHHHLGPGTERLSRSLREGREGVRDGHCEDAWAKRTHTHTHRHQHTWEFRNKDVFVYVKLHF